MGDLLRACGQNPTLAEIGELEKSAGGDCELPFLLTENKRSRSGHRIWPSSFIWGFGGLRKKKEDRGEERERAVEGDQNEDEQRSINIENKTGANIRRNGNS